MSARPNKWPDKDDSRGRLAMKSDDKLSGFDLSPF